MWRISSTRPIAFSLPELSLLVSWPRTEPSPRSVWAISLAAVKSGMIRFPELVKSAFPIPVAFLREA